MGVPQAKPVMRVKSLWQGDNGSSGRTVCDLEHDPLRAGAVGDGAERAEEQLVRRILEHEHAQQGCEEQPRVG